MPLPRRIVRLEGAVYKAAEARAGHLVGWQGIVDTIICTQASEFLGTWGSTFTGYIHRLRGYMPDVADKRILFYERAKIRGLDGSWPSWSVAESASEIEMGTEWQ